MPKLEMTVQCHTRRANPRCKVKAHANRAQFQVTLLTDLPDFNTWKPEVLFVFLACWNHNKQTNNTQKQLCNSSPKRKWKHLLHWHKKRKGKDQSTSARGVRRTLLLNFCHLLHVLSWESQPKASARLQQSSPWCTQQARARRTPQRHTPDRHFSPSPLGSREHLLLRKPGAKGVKPPARTHNLILSLQLSDSSRLQNQSSLHS